MLGGAPPGGGALVRLAPRGSEPLGKWLECGWKGLAELMSL